MRRGDLTQGVLVVQALRFATPLAIAMMAHGLFNLADMVIVARLGPGAVASVTIAGIVIPIAMLLFDGVSNLTVALVAQAHGSHDSSLANVVAWESMWITIAGGLIFGTLFFGLAGPLVRFFDLEDPNVTAAGIEYLRIMAAGMIGMFLILQTTAVLRGIGNAFWPLVILVGSNLLNIFLDVVLVFGHLGFPKLGVAGAAWATVIAQGLGGAIGLVLLWTGTHEVSLRDHPWRPPFRHLRTLTLVGLPTSLQLTTRVLAVFFLLRIAREAVESGPQDFMDGIGICIRLEMVAVFLGLGWAAAATPLVGQNLGAGFHERAARATWLLGLMAALSMSGVGALLWFLREPILVSIMPEISPVALSHALHYLAVTIPFYAVVAIALVISRALNGAGSTKTGMVIDMTLYLIVLLPLASLLSGADILGISGREQPDPRGAWWAYVATHLAAACVYIAAFRHGHWRKKSMLHRAPAVAPTSTLTP